MINIVHNKIDFRFFWARFHYVSQSEMAANLNDLVFFSLGVFHLVCCRPLVLLRTHRDGGESRHNFDFVDSSRGSLEAIALETFDRALIRA